MKIFKTKKYVIDAKVCTDIIFCINIEYVVLNNNYTVTIVSI